MGCAAKAASETARLAQKVEQHTCNMKVVGSNPTPSTNNKGYMPKQSTAALRRKEWDAVGAASMSEFKEEVASNPPKKMPISTGRPKGSLGKSRLFAEALVGNNAEKVVREVFRKALNPEDKDQGAMLKLLLERILPPIREVNIKQEKQTSISVIVEGVQSFVRDAIEAEVLEDMEDLNIEGSVPEEQYAGLLEEHTNV